MSLGFANGDASRGQMGMDEPRNDFDATLPPAPEAARSPLETNAWAPAPSVPALDVPGYTIARELGRGGMGIVYHARQIRADRDVAIKVILGDSSSGGQEAARFRAEALAASRLQHPAIVAVYDVGEHAGRQFFSMEYCPGGSLAAKLAAGRLTIRESAELLHKIALGVAAAHEAGITHRDLKPGNVLLTADGTPKIGDFGLAKLHASETDVKTELTATGAVLGTPAYMAPEQVNSARRAGPPADVYSLGAMLYEFLTGRHPFRGATTTDTLLLLLTEDAKPPRQLVPAIPAELEAVCLRCLEKDPQRRYPTARELAEDVSRFLNGEPVSALRSGGVMRLVGAIGRVQLQARFAEYGNMLLALAPVMLLPDLWIAAAVHYGWAAGMVFGASTARLIGFVLVIGLFRRWNFKPHGAIERQLWMIWGGYMLCCVAFGFATRSRRGFRLGPDRAQHLSRPVLHDRVRVFHVGRHHLGLLRRNWVRVFGDRVGDGLRLADRPFFVRRTVGRHAAVLRLAIEEVRRSRSRNLRSTGRTDVAQMNTACARTLAQAVRSNRIPLRRLTDFAARSPVAAKPDAARRSEEPRRAALPESQGSQERE
ncbi:MAG: serine/threonine-protein kinase [Pirellulales bacterium]